MEKSEESSFPLHFVRATYRPDHPLTQQSNAFSRSVLSKGVGLPDALTISRHKCSRYYERRVMRFAVKPPC